jgi:hypothetical protein
MSWNWNFFLFPKQPTTSQILLFTLLNVEIYAT